MSYEELKPSGFTEKTPGNILMGAGTVHKGLKFDSTTKKWNFDESLIGATSGGNKLSIVPEVVDVPVDGATVKVKGLRMKQGETASIEINLVELSPEMLKAAVLGKQAESSMEGYSLIESKNRIEEGDYFENIAYIGKKLDGTPIIVILDNALCTSGMSLEGKDKEGIVGTYTFECHQDLMGDTTVLPYHIYYPTPTERNQ